MEKKKTNQQSTRKRNVEKTDRISVKKAPSKRAFSREKENKSEEFAKKMPVKRSSSRTRDVKSDQFSEKSPSQRTSFRKKENHSDTVSRKLPSKRITIRTKEDTSDRFTQRLPSRRTSFRVGEEKPLRERLKDNSETGKRRARKEFFVGEKSEVGQGRGKKIELSRDAYRKNNENESGFDDKRRSREREDLGILQEVVRRRHQTGRSARSPKVLSLAWQEEHGLIRLNKYISNSGICSRREADNLILAGAVTVNGKVVCELGAKVHPTDEVRYEDKILQREKPVYILLNKPKDYITTTSDERDRNNVMMLIEGACPQRVYPVGRLDRDTTGLLLFTNDGELTKRLTHPRFELKKIYQVDLETKMSLADFEQLANGLELPDGFMKPDEVAFVDGQKNVLGITLHSGKNRIVRRLFAALGYEILKLDRVYYAGLTKRDLPRGSWRFLTQAEINILKMST